MSVGAYLGNPRARTDTIVLGLTLAYQVFRLPLFLQDPIPDVWYRVSTIDGHHVSFLAILDTVERSGEKLGKSVSYAVVPLVLWRIPTKPSG